MVYLAPKLYHHSLFTASSKTQGEAFENHKLPLPLPLHTPPFIHQWHRFRFRAHLANTFRSNNIQKNLFWINGNSNPVIYIGSSSRPPFSKYSTFCDHRDLRPSLSPFSLFISLFSIGRFFSSLPQLFSSDQLITGQLLTRLEAVQGTSGVKPQMSYY